MLHIVFLDFNEKLWSPLRKRKPSLHYVFNHQFGYSIQAYSEVIKQHPKKSFSPLFYPIAYFLK
jgi:hypothetical protein